MLIACSPSEPHAGYDPAATTASVKEASAVRNSDSAGSGAPVSGLPFSHGRSFSTLDEYLAHLRENAGPIDQPWWREISPGVYEHVKRMPRAKRETATHTELMQRFGFTR